MQGITEEYCCDKERFEALDLPFSLRPQGHDIIRTWAFCTMVKALYHEDKMPWKHIFVNGHCLASDGTKMSKSKGNGVDPMTLLDEVGADATRWHFYTCSAPWLPTRLSLENVQETQRGFLSTLWNVYSFYVLYAEIDQFNPEKYRDFKSENIMDRWILSKLNTLTKEVDEKLNQYDITNAAIQIGEFTDELSNWYVRTNRERFWGEELTDDKIGAYTTLYRVLTTLVRIAAPFVPFMAEEIYQNLVVNNVPDILDVNNLITMLQAMGVKVDRLKEGSFSFCAESIDEDYLQSDEFLKLCSSLRGSVMLMGPLLARFGRALISKPGGDKIGRRRLDTHFLGLIKLGASFSYNEGRGIYELAAKQLNGTYMLLDEASVTGTANIVMAAVLTPGKTTIYNAACEPYLQQLCKMLNAMGARISGVGSNILEIDGVSELHGCTYRIGPDYMEIGSFIGLAAATRGSISIKGVNPRDMRPIKLAFNKLGITWHIEGDTLTVPERQSMQVNTDLGGMIPKIDDSPWPGFPPDLTSIMTVVATQVDGTVLIHEKMFESRMFFVDKLIDMGAQIILCDPHRAVVIGHDHRYQLRAGKMASPDIRAGIALLIAAMSAKGTSVISNIDQIDRGYEDIDLRLNALGARITRQ